MKCEKKEALCGCDSIIQQLIDLNITQRQSVRQDNDNVQLAAIAVALGGGLAKASQKSCQLNDISQIGEGVTINKLDFDGEDGKCCEDSKITADAHQQATANLTQQQGAEQINENEQLITLAVANNLKSTAIANELNSQENQYTQNGAVIATNTVDTFDATDVLKDNQEKKQVNPANPTTSTGEMHRLRLSEQNFAVKVAFKNEGNILEIVADDKGEVRVDELKPSDASALSADNTVLVALDLDGDHLDISADKDGNIFVNGEKI